MFIGARRWIGRKRDNESSDGFVPREQLTLLEEGKDHGDNVRRIGELQFKLRDGRHSARRPDESAPTQGFVHRSRKAWKKLSFVESNSGVSLEGKAAAKDFR